MIKYMQERLLIMKIIQAKSIFQKLKIYRLYKSSFPRCERKPFLIILSMHKKGKTDIWYIEKDGKFIGMGITINGDDLILLDYFAISPKYRGMGLGTKIIKKLRNLYFDKGFFLEIEKVYEGAENFKETSRRKKFYLSAGLSELDVSANLFGVDIELLGSDCSMTFDSYREFYRTNYGEFAAKNIRHIALK